MASIAQDKEDKKLVCAKCGSCACDACWSEFFGKCRDCQHEVRIEKNTPGSEKIDTVK